jgi:hypothetical protein
MAEWNYAEWAEKAGAENLKHRLSTGDVLLAQANTLASILLVGIGAAMGVAVKLAEGASGVLVWGSVASTLWMALVAAVLVHRCIATRETEVLGSAPLNVYKPEMALSEVEVRRYFMEQIQDRIAFTCRRNSEVAYWLDRCRYAAIATPLVFMLAVLVCGRWG